MRKELSHTHKKYSWKNRNVWKIRNQVGNLKMKLESLNPFLSTPVHFFIWAVMFPTSFKMCTKCKKLHYGESHRSIATLRFLSDSNKPGSVSRDCKLVYHHFEPLRAHILKSGLISSEVFTTPLRSPCFLRVLDWSLIALIEPFFIRLDIR